MCNTNTNNNNNNNSRELTESAFGWTFVNNSVTIYQSTRRNTVAGLNFNNTPSKWTILTFCYNCVSYIMSIQMGALSWWVERKAQFTLEKEYRYSSTLFVTSALDGGGWPTIRPGPFTPRKERWYAFYRRLGGPQGQSRWVRKISPLTRIRSPDRRARSESLYRLSYPGPQWVNEEEI
jgi:hypothetical protein